MADINTMYILFYFLIRPTFFYMLSIIFNIFVVLKVVCNKHGSPQKYHQHAIVEG